MSWPETARRMAAKPPKPLKKGLSFSVSDLHAGADEEVLHHHDRAGRSRGGDVLAEAGDNFDDQIQT